VDRAAGAETQVRAQYLIAADGAPSRVRKTLGVTMIGREAMYASVNIATESATAAHARQPEA
jgi:2-polyprenyl-6-methoxyphenol hydroxylase-like FAD-dependent oxidoreductase